MASESEMNFTPIKNISTNTPMNEQLFEAARGLLEKLGTLSTSLLMRKFKIDYEMAERIMLELEIEIYMSNF